MTGGQDGGFGSDHEVAAALATEAGELLLRVRGELADATAAERKDAGDKRSHDFLMDALAKARTGEITHFTGIDSPYQRPKNPDLRLTPERSPEELADLVVELIESRP